MPSLSAARSRRGVLAAAAVAALALVLGGCGGGGGDDNGNNPTGRATVTGRLVNGITGEGVAGATVEYVASNGSGSSASTTSADGSDPGTARGVFVLSVPAPGTGIVRITAPGYYPFGVYNNLTFRLVQDGVGVPETVAGGQVDLGNIRLYSTDGPPPPPSL